jgi:hypothetical protein
MCEGVYTKKFFVQNLTHMCERFRTKQFSAQNMSHICEGFCRKKFYVQNTKKKLRQMFGNFMFVRMQNRKELFWKKSKKIKKLTKIEKKYNKMLKTLKKSFNFKSVFANIFYNVLSL